MRGGRIALAVLVLSIWVTFPSLAAVDVSGDPEGIAVVPFSSGAGVEVVGRDLPDVAALLAGELAARSSSPVIRPSALRRDERGLEDPQARDVRRWAAWNNVDRVIVGRTARGRSGGIDVDVELRSGHSGATEAEYRVAVEEGSDPTPAVEELAMLILGDLGDAPSGDTPPVAAPSPGSEEATLPSAGTEEADEGGPLALLPGLKRDDPIAIESEELEVLPSDEGRRLVFSRNVTVLQGEVRLRTDRLEVLYPPGSSQPDLLIADGHVSVRQGERHARCEAATYRRVEQTIVCRGRAEIVQGCDRVRGREIQFDLEEERVRVTGAASVVIRPEEGGTCVGDDL